MSVYHEDNEHVYQAPPEAPATRNTPTLLEWLTLGKLSVILGSFALVVITIVSTLYGAPQ